MTLGDGSVSAVKKIPCISITSLGVTSFINPTSEGGGGVPLNNKDNFGLPYCRFLF